MTTIKEQLRLEWQRHSVFKLYNYQCALFVADMGNPLDGLFRLMTIAQSDKPHFNRWESGSLQTDEAHIIAQLNQYGYNFVEGQGFLKDGKRAPTFDEIFVKRADVTVQKTTMFDPNEKNNIKTVTNVLVPPVPNAALDKIVDAVNPKLAPTKKNIRIFKYTGKPLPVTSRIELEGDKVTYVKHNGERLDKTNYSVWSKKDLLAQPDWVEEIQTAVVAKTLNWQRPRDSKGKWMRKRLVARFEYTKPGQTISEGRVVVVDQSNPDRNRLCGYDVKRKAYRSFSKARMKNGTSAMEYIDTTV